MTYSLFSSSRGGLTRERPESCVPREIAEQACCSRADLVLYNQHVRMPLMDETALIAQAKRGDLDAFNTLVLHYQDALFNLALRIVGDEDMAADATQDAFLSAFRGLRGFRGGSFKAWLMRTVTNECYDELRRRKRRPSTSLEPEGEDGDRSDAPRWMADPSRSPEEQAEASELEHALQHCLERLPLEFRTVVVLADIEGLDYTDVAASVRVPLGTIKSRLARARLRLRNCLREFEELLPVAFRLDGEPAA
jgi:RNA polymerase sigma-70 factor (ECF subfamily)